MARSRALLRRVHADSEPQREVLEFGELTIDVSGHKVLVSVLALQIGRHRIADGLLVFNQKNASRLVAHGDTLLA